MPLVEAMCCDCPVICSNTTSLPEVGGEAAYYIEPQDPQMLAEAIYRVCTDTELRQDLIQKGKEQAKKFTWTNFTIGVLEALNLLEGGTSEAPAWKHDETTVLIPHPPRFDRQDRAQNLLHQAQEHQRQGKKFPVVKGFLRAVFLAPEVVFMTVIFPSFRDRVLRRIFKLFPV